MPERQMDNVTAWSLVYSSAAWQPSEVCRSHDWLHAW